LPYISPYKLVCTAGGALARAKPLPGLFFHPPHAVGLAPDFDRKPPPHASGQAYRQLSGCVLRGRRLSTSRQAKHEGVRLAAGSAAWPVAHLFAVFVARPALRSKSTARPAQPLGEYPSRGLAARRHAGGGTHAGCLSRGLHPQLNSRARSDGVGNVPVGMIPAADAAPDHGGGGTGRRYPNVPVTDFSAVTAREIHVRWRLSPCGFAASPL
jgi:hypothetical protein